MSNNLNGKKIVVVGGSSGIGFGVAKAALLDRAAEVVVVSSSKTKVGDAVTRLRKVVGDNAGLNGEVKGEVVDATKSEEIKALFSRIGELDHLVWTSGGGIASTGIPFKEKDLDTNRDLFDLKFWGAATAAQVAKFRDGVSASLTLTTGTSMFKPPPGWSLAASGLGAFDTLGRGLAVELAPVRVNTICPGLVTTELWDNSGFPKAAQTAMAEDFAKKLLVKHVADADEIADAYLFVMKCKYITGQTVMVDGGYSLSP